jgi:hypothetical protein
MNPHLKTTQIRYYGQEGEPMNNLFAKCADPRIARIAWVLIGLVGIIIAGGAPTGPSGPGG